MTSTPLVSIIMPVYNGSLYISSAIQSICSQTYPHWELIILDDGSTDGTLSCVQSIQDHRIRTIIHKKNKGLAYARNHAISESRGLYIAFLDADDIALPSRIQTQVSYLDTHKDISFLGSWVRTIDGKGKIFGPVWKHAVSPDVISAILLFRNCFTQSSMIIRKECFDTFQFRDIRGPSPDYDLWTRMVHTYACANIPEVLTQYRVTDGAMSNKDEDSIEVGVKETHAEHLRRLGIRATEEEITLHDGLERWRTSYIPVQLRKIHEWLYRLYLANQSHQIYIEPIFSKILTDYWVKVCCLSSAGGREIWQIYRDSFLANLPSSNWKKRLLVKIFCLSKRSRLIDVTSQDWIRYFH